MKEKKKILHIISYYLFILVHIDDDADNHFYCGSFYQLKNQRTKTQQAQAYKIDPQNVKNKKKNKYFWKLHV